MLSFFYRFRQFIYSAIFFAYVWLLHPWLLDVLKDARGNGQTYVLLGVVIILVQLLELPGIWLKKPLVSERIR